MSNGDISYYITSSGYGFTIPASSIIDGIEVEIERSDNSGGGNIKDNSLRLIKGGIISGADNSAGGNWPSTDAYVTYGSPTDLWGLTWLETDINASNFGVAFSAKRSGGGAVNSGRIDHIRITVYYTPIPLPIELLYFNCKDHLVVWTALDSRFVEKFEVYGSYDLVNWTICGIIPSKWYEPVSDYEFEPKTHYPYYRLSKFTNGVSTVISKIIVCPLKDSDLIDSWKVYGMSGRLILSVSGSFDLKLLKSPGAYIIESYIKGNLVMLQLIQI